MVGIILNRANITPHEKTRLWLNSLPSAPSKKTLYAVDRAIRSSVISGVYTLLDRWWLWAQDNEINSLTSIVNPTSTVATRVNSPSWRPYLGFKDGAGAYINTNFNPSTHGVNFTQNSISHGVYLLENISETANEHGLFDGTSFTSIAGRLTTNKSHCGTNQTAASLTQWDNINSTGHFVGVRTSSTGRIDYRNGEIKANYTASSSALINSTFYALARNNTGAGSPDVFSSKRQAILWYGSGTIDQTLMNNIIQRLAIDLEFKI